MTITVPDPSARSCELTLAASNPDPFRVPVTLSCRLQSADEVSTYRMMGWDPSVSAWMFVPSANNAVAMACEASLAHVTTYRCVPAAGG